MILSEVYVSWLGNAYVARSGKEKGKKMTISKGKVA